MSRSRSLGPGRAHSTSRSAVTSPSFHSTFSNVTSPWTNVSDSNGTRAGARRATSSAASASITGSTCSRVIARCSASSTGPVGSRRRPRAAGGRARSAGGRRGPGVVQRREPHGELVDRAAALGFGEVGPAVGEGHARHALAHEPVLSATAAVGHDRRVADLRGEHRGDHGLAVEPVVRVPVDPHGVGGGEPDLVGHAARPLQGHGGVEPGAAQRRACPHLGQCRARLRLSRSHGGRSNLSRGRQRRPTPGRARRTVPSRRRAGRRAPRRRRRPPDRPTGTSRTDRSGRTWPGRPRAGSSAGPCGRAARTPGPTGWGSAGRSPAAHRRDPGSCGVVAPRSTSGASTRPGSSSSPANRSRSSSVASAPLAGDPSTAVAVMPSGRARPRGRSREPDVGALRHEGAEALVGGVAVDPARARCRDRLVTVERETRGVAEQQPHGGAGRSGRFVQVEDLLLGGDEDRRGGEELRHGGEREPLTALAPRRARPSRRRQPAARRVPGHVSRLSRPSGLNRTR